jgi:hypothetical protein
MALFLITDYAIIGQEGNLVFIILMYSRLTIPD